MCAAFGPEFTAVEGSNTCIFIGGHVRVGFGSRGDSPDTGWATGTAVRVNAASGGAATGHLRLPGRGFHGNDRALRFRAAPSLSRFLPTSLGRVAEHIVFKVPPGLEDRARHFDRRRLSLCLTMRDFSGVALHLVQLRP